MNNGKKIILDSDIFQLSLATEEHGNLASLFCILIAFKGLAKGIKLENFRGFQSRWWGK